MPTDPNAGKPADPKDLVNIPRVVAAYYTGKPDAAVHAQRVAFGTSGHRGSSLSLSFNEAHILAAIRRLRHPLPPAVPAHKAHYLKK